ncbi:hypothetical protein OHB54_44970 [Streptomyces sp. NBC_01007]|nr:hypothetical protein OHB54_44970 [Streptomyces sp. NBC_01007]
MAVMADWNEVSPCWLGWTAETPALGSPSACTVAVIVPAATLLAIGTERGLAGEQPFAVGVVRAQAGRATRRSREA